jgi:hypothetical protein
VVLLEGSVYRVLNLFYRSTPFGDSHDEFQCVYVATGLRPLPDVSRHIALVALLLNRLQ